MGSAPVCMCLSPAVPSQATQHPSNRQAKAPSGAVTLQMPIPVEFTRRMSVAHSPSAAV